MEGYWGSAFRRFSRWTLRLVANHLTIQTRSAIGRVQRRRSSSFAIALGGLLRDLDAGNNKRSEHKGDVNRKQQVQSFLSHPTNDQTSERFPQDKK